MALNLQISIFGNYWFFCEISKMGDVGVRSPLIAPTKPLRRSYKLRKEKGSVKQRKETLLASIPLLYRNNCITLQSYRGEIR